MPASLRAIEAWHLRRHTVSAMVLLSVARLVIALVPLRLWRRRLGLSDAKAQGGVAVQSATRAAEAHALSRHVERAAARLPFATKCLPRAMALSIMLRQARIAHRVVFAVRPRSYAGQGDRLHAWVEHDDALLIGNEPGPWIRLLALGAA